MSINHLQRLESEAIHILREAVSELDSAVLLFSGGKDSTVLAHLAAKAFWPGEIPFSLLHVDTHHNFVETIEHRDFVAKKYGFNLIVASVEETIKAGRAVEESGPQASRNRIQSVTLMDAIKKYNFDCCFGGARRDEEKSRAKERFFSHRNVKGEWLPDKQRPELWSLYNCHKKIGEHFRVFPLSNWTELDVWEYIRQEKINLPSLYFAHEREVFNRNGSLYFKASFMTLLPGEEVVKKWVRFRTIGDITCTGAIESQAKEMDEVIKEIAASRISERGSRVDDKFSEAAMEERKKEGYF